MTALAANRGVRERAIKFIQVVLGNAITVYSGSAIFWDPTAHKATNAPATGLKFLGFYTGNPVGGATGKFVGDGTTKINVDLVTEILLSYFVNAGGGSAIASTDFLNQAYALDDTTASILATDGPALGVIWDVDTRYGIGIQKSPAALLVSPPVAAVVVPPAFAANDLAPASVVNGAIYDVPATGAASTITLPAAAGDGTIVYFAADGTKNANTVQYRDATGPTNLTTALTAAKRHLVVLAKEGGKWFANAYVSP